MANQVTNLIFKSFLRSSQFLCWTINSQIFKKPDAHYHVQNSLPLNNILSQKNAVHILTCYTLHDLCHFKPSNFRLKLFLKSISKNKKEKIMKNCSLWE